LIPGPLSSQQLRRVRYPRCGNRGSRHRGGNVTGGSRGRLICPVPQESQ
jgi:hypothetical protein